LIGSFLVLFWAGWPRLYFYLAGFVSRLFVVSQFLSILGRFHFPSSFHVFPPRFSLSPFNQNFLFVSRTAFRLSFPPEIFSRCFIFSFFIIRPKPPPSFSFSFAIPALCAPFLLPLFLSTTQIASSLFPFPPHCQFPRP